MSGSLRHALAVAAGCALGLGAAAAPAAGAGDKLYLYDVKLGVKGGATLDGTYNEPPGSARPGDVIEEHFKASFSIDVRFGELPLATAPVPGQPATLATDRPAVLNGTWTTQGVKWIDPNVGLSGPYTCGGRIGSSMPDPPARLAFKRQSSRFAFTVHAIADQLTSAGACDVNGRRGGVEHANANAYRSSFTVPKSLIGRKSFSRQVSGPVASQPWRQYECYGCTFTTAWQGTVKFTRKRTIVVPRIRRP